ncbi:DUF697 domain-containing protein [Candidatus Electronema halotolerans]
MVEEQAVNVEKNSADFKEQDDRADKCVMRYTYGSMGIGLMPFPLVDLAALSALQLKMLHSLADLYEVKFMDNLGKASISSLAGGYLPVASTSGLAASLAKFVPGVGSFMAYGSAVMLNGAATYAIGKVFAQHFASGGTFLTFDPEAVREYFAKQYEKGKEVVSSLKNDKEKTASTAASSTSAASAAK